MKVGVLLFEIQEGDSPNRIEQTLKYATNAIKMDIRKSGFDANFIGTGPTNRDLDFAILDIDKATLDNLARYILATWT